MVEEREGVKRSKNSAASRQPLATAEIVLVSELKANPRNYRRHPADQLAHLVESVRRFGVYRNIVCAKDGTLLAGHGVLEAARKAGLKQVPVVRLDLGPDEPAALKLMVGDNEIEHLADQEDRLLAELLKWIKDTDPVALLGTGFDDMMLANFLMVTRPVSEIKDFDAAAEWVGMPDYHPGPRSIKVIVLFANKRHLAEFSKRTGLRFDGARKLYSTWYPPRKRRDIKSVRFVG